MTTDEFTQTGDRAYFSLYQEVYLEALGWRPYCWFEFKSSSFIIRTTPVVSAGQMHMFYTGRLPAGEQFLASNPFSEGSCAKNVDYIAWWFIQNGVQDLRAVAGIVGTICGELGGVVDFCGCEKWESGLTPSWPQPLRNFPVRTQRTSTSTGQRAYGIGSTTSPPLVNALKAKFTATQLQHDYYNSNTIVYSTEDPIIEDYARYECEAILEAMKAGGKESGFTFDQFAKGQTGFSVEKCVAFVMAQYEMPGWSMSSAQSYRGYPSRRDYGRAVYQRI